MFQKNDRKLLRESEDMAGNRENGLIRRKLKMLSGDLFYFISFIH